ncbi:MAG: PEP-CTERM sorting domain-containing protein [Phenylobacterium sp.]|nr:MAG: PEP-CTERM sorting domain-containing protein [Phenylobacterium sp.]
MTTTRTVDDPPPVAGVPEPATWALLILGFATVGAALRRRTVAA